MKKINFSPLQLALLATGSITTIFATTAFADQITQIPSPSQSINFATPKNGDSVINTLPDGTVIQTYKNGVVVKRKGKHITIFVPPGLKNQAGLNNTNQSKPVQHLTGRGDASASINAPNALGPSVPVIFANLLYVNKWPNTSSADGGGGVGFSVGNPHKNLGLLVNLSTSSMGFGSDSFGSSGGVGMRLNRYLTNTSAFALGMSNLVGWGVQAPAAKGYYAAFTKTYDPSWFLPMTFNVGGGTGGFSSINSGASGEDKNLFPFASAGIELYRNLSAIVDWTTGQVSVGATYTWTIIPKAPIFIGAYAVNLNQYQNTSVHFQGVVGISHAFL